MTIPTEREALAAECKRLAEAFGQAAYGRGSRPSSAAIAADLAAFSALAAAIDRLAAQQPEQPEQAVEAQADDLSSIRPPMERIAGVSPDVLRRAALATQPAPKAAEPVSEIDILNALGGGSNHYDKDDGELWPLSEIVDAFRRLSVAAPVEQAAQSGQRAEVFHNVDALTTRALASPQLNRLREWAAIGPVQRADVQMLVIEVLRLANPPASAPLNIEHMLAECIPGGDSCDPQQVADAIRRYCNAWPSVEEAQPSTSPTEEKGE
jgi:hypothetical protein